jgi:hypothetical protein
MRTDELIRMLSSGVEPVPIDVARTRWARALAVSVPIAFLMMKSTLGLLPTLSTAISLPMFWVKLGLAFSLAGAALLAVQRLARPGAALGSAPRLIAAPLLAIWGLAGFVLVRTPAPARAHALLGETWQLCPFLIAGLSIPTFVAALWALRGLAPTQLAAAGAAAGLLAGAVGALVYSLHCPEMAAPFVGSWYVLGILLPAGVGALLGPRVLRW